MARFSTLTKLTGALIAAATLTIGCGTEHNSPVASTDAPTITRAEDGRTYMTFSPNAARHAAKQSNNDPQQGIGRCPHDRQREQ